MDVIAVGAHPDDVEIAIGGTLAKLVKQGYRVGLVDLTNGEPTPGSSGPEQRAEEASNAAKVLGLHLRETLTLPNRWLFDSVDARIALARVFRRHRPKIVMATADKTPIASPDHWQAMQITDAAIFHYHLTKWDEEFDHLPPHRVSKHVWYPLGFQTLQIPDGGSQIVTDISDTLEQKLESIRCYQSQFPPEKERVFTMVESHNRMLGYSAGFEAGELLITATTLGITDLVQTLTK